MSEKTLSNKVDDVNASLRKLTTVLSECEKKTGKAYSNYLNIKKMMEDIMSDQKKIKSDLEFIKKQRATPIPSTLTRRQKTILLCIAGGVVVSILLMLIFIGVRLNVLPTNIIKSFI